MGRYRSGQTGQTVNLLGASLRRFESFSAHTNMYFDKNAGVAQLVEHQPSKLRVAGSSLVSRSGYKYRAFSIMRCMSSQISECKPYADVAQQVEHVLGKDEVTGSSPVISSAEYGCSSIGRVAVSKTVGCGFKSYHPC